MDTTTLVLFVCGFGLLLLGAEALVRGASRMAALVGIPPLVVGLTVVAMGTSMPEMMVSVIGVIEGRPDVAVGNVVGSNTFNILFILGLAALVTPLSVHANLLRMDLPVMVGVSLLGALLAKGGGVTRLEGLILLGLLVAFTTFQIRSGLRSGAADVADGTATGPGPGPGMAMSLLLALAGLGMLVLGTRWFLDGAVAAARSLGVSELVIGLTLVAGGTSLPEVATSVVAALRGQRDIAIGNVVGSNIFNVLGVFGAAAVVGTPWGGLPVSDAVLSFDLPVMVAVTLTCIPFMASGATLDRLEGALFLAGYAAYTAYLVFNSSGHDHLSGFVTITLWFVVPLVAASAAAAAWHAFKRRRTDAS